MKLVTASLVGAMIPFPGAAADITVSSGTTVTTQQTLTTANDKGTVETGGTIDVVDQDGFFMGATDQTVTNNGTIDVQRTAGANIAGIGSSSANSTATNNGSIEARGNNAFGIAGDGANYSVTNNGTISTFGNGGFGIFSLGANAALNNSGTITTSGDGADGIYTDTNSATVTNSGTIITSGQGAYGLSNDATGTTLTNSGTISTSGANSHGIESDVGSVTVTNSGTINVTGDNADGVDIDGNDAVVINSGSITAVDADGNGIDVSGDRANVQNSGRISVSGPDGEGIDVTGNNAQVTNSGSIFSTSGPSISIDGGNATLNLQQGTLLQGLIALSTPASATLNYNADRTAFLTFDNLPNTISTNGLPSWSSGNTLVVVDPNDFSFGSTRDRFSALARDISDTLETQMGLARLPQTSFISTHGEVEAGPTQENPAHFWLTSIGGILDRDGTNGFQSKTAGVMAGAEQVLSNNTRAGIVGGFSYGTYEADSGTHDAKSLSIFGGGYLSRTWQAYFADLSFTGGHLTSEEDVTVLNNMVTGGLQDLGVEYDYVFINPTVRVGRAFQAYEGTFVPSARLRYSGLWQTGGGTQSNTRLTSENRSLHLLETRGQTTYQLRPWVHDSGTLHVAFHAGADASLTLNDNLDASVNGAALNISLDGNTVFRGFAKYEAVWQAHNGFQVSAELEGAYDSEQTLAGSLRLGLRKTF